MENLTLSQVLKYLEWIVKIHNRNLASQTEANYMAAGAGMGNIKFNDLKKFLDNLRGTKISPRDSVELAKKQGFEVEEN